MANVTNEHSWATAAAAGGSALARKFTQQALLWPHLPPLTTKRQNELYSRFIKLFLESSPAGLGSMAQGSRAGTSVEL